MTVVVVAVLKPTPLVPPILNIPVLTFVAPEYVLVPDNVHFPEPLIVRPPVVVVIAPLSMPVPVPPKTKPNVFPVMPPLNVNVPLPDASISAPVPVKFITREVEPAAPT